VGISLAFFFGIAGISHGGINGFKVIDDQLHRFPSISFEPNLGQIFDQYGRERPDILLRGKGSFFITDVAQWGLAYYFVKPETTADLLFLEKKNKERRANNSQYSIHRVELRWLGGLAEMSRLHFSKPKGTVTHYYNLPYTSTPVVGVPLYEEVTASDIFQGISLRLSIKNGILELDWHLAKAELIDNIVLECRGATPRIDNSGRLVLETPLGAIVEDAPIAFQDGKKLPCFWQVSGSLIKLELFDFEPHKPVVIDPPVRNWGSFFGGNGIESIYHSATDDLGNLIVAGYTLSLSQIATSGSFQTVFGGTAGGGPGAYYAGGDAFVAKFSPSGQLQWATYLGGPADEEAFSCAINSSGHIYVTGHTASSSGIATPGGHQDSLKGLADMFVIKLNENGIKLWGTYFGGPEEDIAWDCATDPSGNLFVVGQTKSTSHISTLGVHQHISGGNTDAVVARFSGSGQLMWASYLGGTANDVAYSCTVDPSGNVYFTGRTFSTNNMVSFGAHQTVYQGAGDAFLAKFNATGNRLWSTYIGGTGPDIGFDCHFSNGRLVVCGYTNSISGIATPGTHRAQLLGADAFLAMFSSNGQRQWGTYLGGSNEDYALSCQLTMNNILVAGYTNSSDSLSSNDAFQAIYMGGYDGYMALFDTTGQRQYATYYGGMSDEYDCRAVQSQQGYIYFSGQSGSAFDGTITTPLAHQPFFGGGLFDGFVSQFLTCDNLTAQASVIPSVVCAGTNIQLTASPNGASAYHWTGPAGFISTAQNPIIPNIQLPQSGYYHLIVDVSNQCNDTLYDSVWVSVLPTPDKPQVADTTIFIGQQVLLIAQQPPGYQTFWYISPTGGSPIATGPVFLTPKLYQTTKYYVEFQVGNCASARDTVKITVIDNTGISEALPNTLLVFPQPVSDWLYLHWPHELQQARISCFTLQGSLVKSVIVSPSSAAFSVHDLPAGTYILELHGVTQSWRTRFVVVR
jgi:uncharacterized protein (DUF2147 family)